jgi:hypothetical protein
VESSFNFYIMTYCARVRGLNLRTVHTLVCMDMATPARKNIISHFGKFVRRGFKKNAVNCNEASRQSNFDNLGYHRLVYTGVNLYNHIEG